MDDFDRNVWCLLGLPFDAIDLETTVTKIHEAAINKTPCFISTPNLNFLIASQKDKKFRDSVINSDLSVADGKPIIWLARLLNIPLPERVAGSDLIESLIENKEGYKPLKVFFFGGMEGVAEQACINLNAQNKGLQCAGFHTPGFGSIEEMSTSEIINSINQSGADFVIVSLGAKKGQEWIVHNRARLNAPIISHLGAVVNFIAGNVKRSPKLMQRLGLEWLWRIKEEPSLWRRYFSDFLGLLNLLAFNVVPLCIKQTTQRPTDYHYHIDVNKASNSTRLTLKGYFGERNINELKEIIKNHIHESREITITINNNCQIDESFSGLLIVLKKICSNLDCKLRIVTDSNSIRKRMDSSCCRFILSN